MSLVVFTNNLRLWKSHIASARFRYVPDWLFYRTSILLLYNRDKSKDEKLFESSRGSSSSVLRCENNPNMLPLVSPNVMPMCFQVIESYCDTRRLLPITISVIFLDLSWLIFQKYILQISTSNRENHKSPCPSSLFPRELHISNFIEERKIPIFLFLLRPPLETRFTKTNLHELAISEKLYSDIYNVR